MMNNDMNDMQTNIERMVMRRVHLIRILKLIISTAVFATLAFVATLWGIGQEVWVAHVFENSPDGFFGRLGYLWYAFVHTRLLVQVLMTLTLTSLGFLIREVVRLSLNLFAPSRV